MIALRDAALRLFWRGGLAALLLAAVVLFGVLAPGRFGSLTATALAGTLAWFGWFYLVVVGGVLVCMLYLALGRYAEVRIGGEDARPEFHTASWFAMLFSAGMGIGLVFFGAAEPLSHYLAPPEGLEPQSAEAARAAMRYSFFHWGLHPWAVYGLVGLAMAHARYNHGATGRMAELLRPLLRAWTDRAPGRAVDVLAILATAGGVATTLGYGAVQIASGLHRLFGIDPGIGTQLLVIAVATVLFLASAATGLQRGVKLLSQVNLVVAMLLLGSVFLLGPTRFLLDTFTTTVGGYLNQLPGMSLRTTPFSGRTWVADWTVFYWAWWISWAPFVGAFIARISRGRTIRSFVVGVLGVPCLFGFLWFTAFGGTALHIEMFGEAGLAAAAEVGSEGVLFAVFDQLPGAPILAVAGVLLLCTFFVTSADSATLVLASMARGGADDAPFSARLLWGLLQVGVAVALLLAGGLAGLQSGAVIAALPFAAVLCLVAWSLLRRLEGDHRAAAARERERRRAVDELLRERAALSARAEAAGPERIAG